MFVVYYQKPHLTLYYDEPRSLGKAVWNGFVSGSEFRESVLASLQLIRGKRVRLWIADQREMRAIRLKDQEWVNEEVVPQLMQSSLEKMAVIASRDMFNRIAIEGIVKKAAYQVYFEISHFKDEQPAESWILQSHIKNIKTNNSFS
jgi:hypothetical protein